MLAKLAWRAWEGGVLRISARATSIAILPTIAIVAISGGAALAQFKATVPHSSPMTAPALPAPTMPAPAMPSVPTAPPLQVVPPPPVRDTRAPDGGGPDACDCYVAEQVPVMSNGRVISYERRNRWVGKSVQCCPSR
jgi:hypothetical protein